MRVRSEAGTNGEVLTNLNKGAKGRLLSRLEEEVTIGGKKGNWAYVQTEENVIGRVFDVYLKKDK